jgi:hypothetical protein
MPTEFDRAGSIIDQAMKSVRIEPPGRLADMPQGELMREFRYLLDLYEKAESISKSINKKLVDIKAEMINRSEIENNTKFTSDLLTVSVDVKEKFNIRGDWPDIQTKLIEAGLGTSVQRRISEKHVLEAFYAGELRLPDGLEIFPVRTVSHRRRNG